VKPPVVLAAALAALLGARVARGLATDDRRNDLVDTPYAPSASAAPYVSLGYRELLADLLWLRLTGYFADDRSTGDGVANLVEAIVALDPHFQRPYEWGARAITAAHYGVDQRDYLRAVGVLEHGADAFPDDWRLPYLAGQIYTQDLVTSEAAQRRAWDEKGTLLIESAIRKPGAPAEAAEWAAVMRTKLGEHERAVQGLREMLLVTSDSKAQQRLVDRLAELEKRDADELRIEVTAARIRFDRAWREDRPLLPATMYVLIGPHLDPAFDLSRTATGGRDLLQLDAPAPGATSEAGPSSP
jgi:hypothetical protein